MCLLFSNNNHWQPPSKQLGQEVPLVPLRKLATDIFHFENSSYLLEVDYHSRFPVIRKLHRTTAKHVTNHIQSMFSEYGWPDILISDNGLCHTGVEFRQAIDDISIHHISRSPHYHKPNGLTKTDIQLAKCLLYKAKELGKDPYFALMLYKITPICHDLPSHMKLLCARQATSDLPMSHAARMQVKQAAICLVSHIAKIVLTCIRLHRL